MAKVGGATAVDVTDDHKKVANDLSGAARRMYLGAPEEQAEVEPWAQFVVLEVMSQVVAGTNLFIKVQVAEAEFIQMRVFKPLPHTGSPPKLVALLKGESASGALAYFEG